MIGRNIQSNVREILSPLYIMYIHSLRDLLSKIIVPNNFMNLIYDWFVNEGGNITHVTMYIDINISLFKRWLGPAEWIDISLVVGAYSIW